MKTYSVGGIQVSNSGVFTIQNNLPVTQMLDMGRTTKTQAELEAFLRSIRSRFTQMTYDLINNNCNNFSDTVCNFLTGHGIPQHIVDLPRIVFNTPGGAMLRPMIENMQNNINQQMGGGGMDPFGHAAGREQVPPQHMTPQQHMFSHQHNPAHVTQAALHSVAAGVSAVGAAASAVAFAAGTVASAASATAASAPPGTTAAAATATVPASVTTLVEAKLEEAPLISGDASALTGVVQKLLKAPAPVSAASAEGDAVLFLQQSERGLVEEILSIVHSKCEKKPAPNTSTVGAIKGSNGSTRFPLGSHALFLRILKEGSPTLQLSTFFLLRLVLLHDDTDFSSSECFEYRGEYIALLKQLVEMLLRGVDIFQSAGAAVMAICSLSNALARSYCLQLFVVGDNGSDHINEQLLASVVDIAMAGVSHARAEVRQMSATLAYNFALACRSSLWVAGGDDCDMHMTVVPLLCGCLEDIGNNSEKDASIRYRLLAVVCRIVRVYGKKATSLIDDLGYGDMIEYLRQGGAAVKPPLTAAEAAVVHELAYYLRN